MKASFENSVAVLVRAYMNDTLQAMSCSACAVGNLVAAANGYSFKNRVKFDASLLHWDHCNGSFEHWPEWQIVLREDGSPEGVRQIESTGYTIEQLVRIEDAFISHTKDTFNGLLAVVDVLAEIHGVDLSTKQEAIGQFETVHASK